VCYVFFDSIIEMVTNEKIPKTCLGTKSLHSSILLAGWTSRGMKSPISSKHWLCSKAVRNLSNIHSSNSSFVPKVGPVRRRKLHIPSTWVKENSLGHTLLGNISPARVRLILWIRKRSTVYWWTHHLGISFTLDLRFKITLSLFTVYWLLLQLITLISD
jgi:hypothetical protein